MQYSNPECAPRLADLFSLKGRAALIVGGSGLLGGEISYAFAELGAELIIASRDEVRCGEFVGTLRQQFPGVVAHSLKVDITNLRSIRELMSDVSDITGGGLDVLVNSGWSGRKNTFESISDEDWNNDIEICLNGVFRTIKAAVPLLKERSGNILTIASM
jgi:gluconate 5-dehydrogenase